MLAVKYRGRTYSTNFDDENQPAVEQVVSPLILWYLGNYPYLYKCNFAFFYSILTFPFESTEGRRYILPCDTDKLKIFREVTQRVVKSLKLKPPPKLY